MAEKADGSTHGLTDNLDKLHTTKLGLERIKRNLILDDNTDAVSWCREIIKAAGSTIMRKGKNWYIQSDSLIITVNTYSYTIITAHKLTGKENIGK